MEHITGNLSNKKDLFGLCKLVLDEESSRYHRLIHFSVIIHHKGYFYMPKLLQLVRCQTHQIHAYSPTKDKGMTPFENNL